MKAAVLHEIGGIPRYEERARITWPATMRWSLT